MEATRVCARNRGISGVSVLVVVTAGDRQQLGDEIIQPFCLLWTVPSGAWCCRVDDRARILVTVKDGQFEVIKGY